MAAVKQNQTSATVLIMFESSLSIEADGSIMMP
jgi:hypothetical protein